MGTTKSFFSEKQINWANEILGEKKNNAEILAKFIVSKKSKFTIDYEKKPSISIEKINFLKDYDEEECKKLFTVMLARIEGWNFENKERTIYLRDSFYKEFNSHIEENGLTDKTFDDTDGFQSQLLERVIQMQLCYLFAIKKAPINCDNDNIDTLLEKAKTIYTNYTMDENIKILEDLMNIWGLKNDIIIRILSVVRKLRNEIHFNAPPRDKHGEYFQYYIFAFFLFSAVENFLETREDEIIKIEVKLKEDQKNYTDLKIQGTSKADNVTLKGSPFNKQIQPSQHYLRKLPEGQYEFRATCDGKEAATTCVVERGNWIREVQVVTIDFNPSNTSSEKPSEKPSEKNIPNPNVTVSSPTINNRDKTSFADYKEEKKKELVKKYAEGVTDNVLGRITSIPYDDEKSLAGNKTTVDTIVSQIENQLAKENNPWRKFGKQSMNVLAWVEKNWKWCAGLVAIVVISFVAINYFGNSNSVTVSEGEAVPSLQATWRVRLMNGEDVNDGATFTMVAGSNSQYNVKVISDKGDVLDTFFNVDWQTGNVTSPELGKGKIEKVKGSNNLKIVFDKWIFESVRSY